MIRKMEMRLLIDIAGLQGGDRAWGDVPVGVRLALSRCVDGVVIVRLTQRELVVGSRGYVNSTMLNRRGSRASRRESWRMAAWHVRVSRTWEILARWAEGTSERAGRVGRPGASEVDLTGTVRERASEPWNER
jgi:hypothetical protein